MKLAVKGTDSMARETSSATSLRLPKDASAAGDDEDDEGDAACMR